MGQESSHVSLGHEFEFYFQGHAKPMKEFTSSIAESSLWLKKKTTKTKNQKQTNEKTKQKP